MTAFKCGQERVISVDSIRGFIILLMILEHSRYCLSGIMIYEYPGVSGVASLSAGAALIRYLSHLCAPGFFFILGMSIVLVSFKKTDPIPLGRIIKRGLLLMGLQLTVVNFGWALPHFLKGGGSFAEHHPLYLGVLFSLGCVYIMAGLINRLSGYMIVLCLMGITGICFSFDYSSNDSGNILIGLILTGIWEKNIELPFPLFPWMAVTMAGVMYARYFFRENRTSRGVFWIITFLMAGVIAWVTFRIYPGIFYKYPPSLPFLLITVLIIVLLIRLFNAVAFLNMSWLRSIGRHALLLYVLHIYLAGLAAVFLHGDHLMQTLTVAISVMALCVLVIRIFESDLFMGPYLNVFNIYHRFYDRFMLFFSLYRPDEIRRSLSITSDGIGSIDGKSKTRLLDIAGGTGYIAKQLHEWFKEIIIIDLSLAMLRVAKERKLTGLRGSAHSLPFLSDTFTAIICTEALHHIKHADSAVREMRRVLKTGGRIVIQEFHIKGVTGFIFFLFERLLIDHSEFITPKELEVLMADYGFCGTTRPISKIGYIYEGYLAG